MILINPMTGGEVDAAEECVEFLQAAGFKPKAEPQQKPEPKPQPKAPRKPRK